MISREDSATYCAVVFADPPTGSFVALRGLPEAGKAGRPLLRWVDPTKSSFIESVQHFIEECDELGLAAYCLPGFVGRHGGATSSDVVGFSVVAADFDTGIIPMNISKAAEVLGRPTLIVNSGGTTPEGHAKRHCYWRTVGEGRTVERVVALRAAIASAFGADMSFSRPAQPIRLGGSVWHKGAPTTVRVAFHDPTATISIPQSEVRLRPLVPAGGKTSGGDGVLGFSRQVSLDDLPMMSVGHGNASISRFEALTRMAGSTISSIHDVTNAEQVEREFGYFKAWAVTHIENVERDYNLRQHFYRLAARERAKREWRAKQPRRKPQAGMRF